MIDIRAAVKVKDILHNGWILLSGCATQAGMSGISRYIIANWKMNHRPLPAWAQAVAMACVDEAVQVVLCPAFTQLAAAQMVLTDTPIQLGAQDCHDKESGAYTGDVSADMLKRAGCQYVIVGHSERRQYHQETDEIVAAKAKAAMKHGLTPIICVGESLEQRDVGTHKEVVAGQLVGINSLSPQEYVVAYEPVWAIGTGKVPTSEDIGEMHTHIKNLLHSEVAVVYGGSVKPDNAGEILALAAVDGVLVGGASLEGEGFAKIVMAA